MSGKTIPYTCKEDVAWLVMQIHGLVHLSSELLPDTIAIHSLETGDNQIQRVINEIVEYNHARRGEKRRCPIAQLR